MQQFSYLARKASFLVQDLQEKYLQDWIFVCKMVFTGQIAISGTQLTDLIQPFSEFKACT